jgi:hypothetical protein
LASSDRRPQASLSRLDLMPVLPFRIASAEVDRLDATAKIEPELAQVASPGKAHAIGMSAISAHLNLVPLNCSYLLVPVRKFPELRTQARCVCPLALCALPTNARASRRPPIRGSLAFAAVASRCAQIGG